MTNKKNLFFLLFAVSLLSSIGAEDKFFVFVITSYNNELWVEKNLESIFSQKYDNYHIFYIDDASTDATSQKVAECCSKHNKHSKLTYIRHDHNYKALYGISNTIHSYCKDEHIVVLVDGDDWLTPNPEILQSLNEIYANPEVWMTYGEFSVTSDPHGRHETAPYSSDIITKDSFRQEKFYFMPLRTFYAKLFKKVKISDFFYNKSFIHMTWDMVFGIPMLEMAQSHIYYFSTIVYVYNNTLTTNDNSRDPSQQTYFDFYIRNREPYQPITSLFDVAPFRSALYYFCNAVTNSQILTYDLQLMHSNFQPVATTVGVTKRNTNLLSTIDPAFHVLNNCYYHSWISSENANIEKERLIRSLIAIEADFIILTQNGYNRTSFPFDQAYLTLSDFIIIGKYHQPLEKNLIKKYPHISFLPLNSIGNVLDFRQSSTLIIKKEKLIKALQTARWSNNCYLSLLAIIDSIYGNEYGIFIEAD